MAASTTTTNGIINSNSSPSKRPRSPENNLSAYSSAHPAKLLQSPSTRDSSSSSSTSSYSHRVPPPPLVTNTISSSASSYPQTSSQDINSPITALTSGSTNMQTDLPMMMSSGQQGAPPSSAPLHGSSSTSAAGLAASVFPTSSSSSKTHIRSATTPSARIFSSSSNPNSNSNSPISAMHPTPPVPSVNSSHHQTQQQQQQQEYNVRFSSPQIQNTTNSSNNTSGTASGNSSYRLAGSQSGSTTSGFSGGSIGSSYDGSSILTGGTFSSFDDPTAGISSNSSSVGPSGQHGLGVLVQGPAYGVAPLSAYAAQHHQQPHASSSSSRQIHKSPTALHTQHPQMPTNTAPASASAYYSQPYGYQSATTAPAPGTIGYGSTPAYTTSQPPPTSHQQQFTMSSSGHPAAGTSAMSGGTFPSSISTHHRRSIAGQSSAGGSSYHSGASASPGGHRRSDDLMMDATSFVASGGGQIIQGPPSSLSSMTAPYATPVTEVSSPGLQKQAWSPTAVMTSGPHGHSHVPGQMQHHHQHQQQQQQQQNIPSPSMAGFIDPSKPGVTSPASSYYSNAQNYQAIVDEIMNQTRKGTDYGLDLGDFEMLDTLGTGTFGRVLLVRLHPRASSIAGLNAGMPHYFAMKVLSKAEVVRLKQVEHINCERSILGAVDHLGIVNLFCTFQDSLNIYMLLEFVQGGELFSHLRRAVRFSADVSRFYAANIILVLEYLHNRNLIYRDLKPENLLLDSHGYLKVTDFGFAKYVPDRTFTLCGTPEYLAPEIINSAGHGKAADWWAFGVLLFEMLCGYPPFFDESPWGIYEKILAGNFSFPPHVDPVARDLVRRLLSSDRSKRLGNLRGGAADVKNHQWFEGVDWTAVERRSIPAPIIPRIKSTSDSQNFERYPSIPIETLPGLARAKGIPVKEEVDIYEHMFTSF